MRKTSTYARKLKMKQTKIARAKEHDALLALIKSDLRGLQIDAGLHAWTGEDVPKMINLSGRLCFVAACAGHKSGIDADTTDMRIVRGMANALAELNAHRDAVEQHRPALQSGLAAVDRILTKCDDMNIVLAGMELDGLLSTDGIGTRAIENAMGIAA